MPRTVSRNVLQAVLDTLMDGVLAVDQYGQVLAVNRRFHELWRIPPELQSAEKDSALLSNVMDQLADPNEFMRGVTKLYQSNQASSDLIHFKDGRVYQRTGRQLEGEVAGRMWVFRDVTPGA